ncbi:MAG: flavodoxin-dependent (E)-4-hydroxy-3-methylbut-2-enyl-diphosphate synthase [Porphyromonas sp.]|uniref:flavodoxin-dependent (E)-4-hydroxy-3-methylbut-2-enyl-diphosphate synthase n=1 Tax=Porphyromonas sp. TaxID=1924944 RepID=UPI001A5886B5|nr:flavodoxin-dependent (E)-4-hydroxy-3-methylbut-2-enyl-diphosphate synthase [Porphyromonas sp.]MBL6453012.1 flavodoxin-dependent (E)-4-hydroxy-3-methylbut-2-enyl-diphosphate synthase [Porphyromonas sp.]
MSLCRYQRRHSYTVPVGEARLGGESPLLLQSMANVSTMETDLCVAQALRCASEGCQLFRYTAQGVREATNLGVIAERLNAEGCRMPLVADIHFRSDPAFEALKHVDKVRINPGNFIHQKAALDDETARAEIAEVFGRFVREAQARHRAIRIGVNHGSLSERILAQYGNTPEGMVASCMEYLEVCDSLGMRDVVISMKASNVLVMTQAVRLLVERMDALDWHYPLHLGVTEAGAGEDGRVKSCIGIASLLVDGLGDTLRVSLSEEPEAELRFGKKLIAYIDQLAAFDQTRPIYANHTYRSVTRDQAQRATELAKYPAVLTLDSDGTALDVGFDARLEETQLALSDERQSLQVIDLDTPLDRLLQHLEDFAAHWDGHAWLELRGAELDYIYKVRYAVEQLSGRGSMPRILLHYASHARGYDDILIDCATQLGSLLLEGIGNAVAFSAVAMSPKARLALLNGILQAVRIKMTHTEFISCPGCGRTLFDLQQTVAQVKQRLAHLPNLKIGVMGCIVNGPGEMADADYGYVGGGVGKVDLYRGQKRLVHGIPSAEAVDRLIELIKSDGKWCDPPQQ